MGTQTFASVIGFIGAGKMAQALSRGLVRSGFAGVNQIWTSGPTEEEIRWAADSCLHVTTSNAEVLRRSSVVFLSVKPQILPSVLREINPVVTPDHLLISIAAGVKLDAMSSLLPPHSRLVRAMPNLAVETLDGVTAVVPGESATREDCELVVRMMSSLGYCMETSESCLDVITACVGGGPAFVFLMIEAMADGAVLEGLPRDQALTMVARTVLGAAKMATNSGLHPGQLKDAVCSAGGSTIAGVHSLEKDCFRGALVSAVHRTTQRAKDIGKTMSDSIQNGSSPK